MPDIIYSDFEALKIKIAWRELNPSKRNTQKSQKHGACGYGYIVVRCDGHSEGAKRSRAFS